MNKTRPERGIYFATHFGNWYEHADEAELREYIAELAHWGCSGIGAWFDMHDFRGMDDPGARKRAELVRRVFRAAKANGLRVDLSCLANEAFDSSPEELRADWTGGHDGYSPCGLESHYRREVCPSKPGGLEYLIEARRETLAAFADLKIDSFTIGPYDQGGCTCPACAPWGSNGFVRLAEKLAALFRETVNPDAEIYLSTWNFGQHPDEWRGLRAQGDALTGWVDALEIAPQDMPRLEADPFLPFFCMSDISMNEMLPWGGCGANPLPRRFQRELSEFPHCRGLRPYSEGVYEDLNKVVELAVLSGMAADASEAVGLYAERYFGAETAPLLREAAPLLEENTGHWEDIYQGGVKANPYSFRLIDRGRPWRLGLKGVNLDPARVHRVSALLDECERRMSADARGSWRWRILKIRGEIDQGLLDGAAPGELEEKFLELGAIYKVGPDTSVLLVPPSEKLLRRADSFLFVPEP